MAAEAGAAAAGAAAAVADDLATQRNLANLSLDQSLRFFQTDLDQDQVRVEIPAAGAAGVDMQANITKVNETQNVTNEAKDIANANILSNALLKEAKLPRSLNLVRVPDRLENCVPANFQPDINNSVNIRTVQQMLGHPNGRFYSFVFKSEYERKIMYKQLLEYCLRKANRDLAADPADPDRATKQADRLVLRGAIETELDGINLLSSLDKSDVQNRSQTKTELLRSQTLSNSAYDDLVSPPTYGNESFLSESTLKHINASISLIPFGSINSQKEISSYLTDIKNIASSRYTESAIYLLLIKCLVNKPREVVVNHYKAGTSLAHTWIYIQLIFNSTCSAADCLQKIKTLVNTRPQNLQLVLAELENLIRMKNKHLPPADRKVIIDSEITSTYKTFLQIWYPGAAFAVIRNFEEITLQMNQTNAKDRMPISILFNILCADQINMKPISQKMAQINALQASDPVSELTYENLLSESTKQLASLEVNERKEAATASRPQHGNETDEADINAMNAKRQNYSSNPRKYSRFAKELHGHCFKCGDVNHKSPQCFKYPDEKLSDVRCSQCTWYHSSYPCRGRPNPAQYQFESQRDTQQLAIEHQQQQQHQQQQ